ncbi:MAG: nickel pincer cofactor biosynthesis protein LarC [Planctomycetota bacterium]
MTRKAGVRLHLDAVHGIAGDMLLAALIDLGVPEKVIFPPLRGFLPPFRSRVELRRSRGISCRQLHVEGMEASPPRRNLRQISEMLGAGGLPEEVGAGARGVFRTLAETEGAVHGISPEEVHFHEVGAIDSLVDVIGTLLAVHWIGPETVSCSSLPLGSGTVETAHGIYPVPAPATLRLLEGLPTHPLPVEREVTTPTGVALARALSDRFGPPPSGNIVQIGYGAGSREARPQDPPNLLRIWTSMEAESPGAEQKVTVLETNLDHLSGEDEGHLVECLLGAGALDVFLTPTIQKKSRPGCLVTVICESGAVEPLEERLFLETGTLGIRRQVVQRRVLRRDWSEVEVAGERLRVKRAWLGDRCISARPEYEDLRRVAQATDTPLRELREEVRRALDRNDPSGTGAGAGAPGRPGDC